MKANPHKKILELLSKSKRCNGIEIASIGELKKALKFFDPEDLCFTGPGKTDFELEMAIKKS